jgi:hypothetical protein
MNAKREHPGAQDTLSSEFSPPNDAPIPLTHQCMSSGEKIGASLLWFVLVLLGFLALVDFFRGLTKLTP